MRSVRVFFPKFSRAELVRRLEERVMVLQEVLSLVWVVLFGSWAW